MGVLRSRGYPVVDVPLGLLPTRVRYQLPALVLCDADAPEALERVREMRRNEHAEDLRVVFLGSDQGAIQQNTAFRVEGHGIFFRPLDVDEVCAHIETLIGPPSREPRSDAHSIPPRRAPMIVPSARKPYRSDEGPALSRLSEGPPTSDFGAPFVPRVSLIPSVPAQESDEAPPELSPETKALLDRAQAAASAMMMQASRPTRLTTNHQEAELPSDVLTALDAPLEDPLESAGESEISGGTAGSGVNASDPSIRQERSTAPPTPPSYPSEAAATNPGGRIVSQPAPAESWELPVPSAPPVSSMTLHAPLQGSLLPDTRGPWSATTPPPRRPGDSLPGATEVGSHHGVAPPTHPPRFTPPPPRGGNLSPNADAPVATPRPASATNTEAASIRLADLNRTPEELRPGGAMRVLATAIRERATGALALQDHSGIRRILLRDGDIVTAVSGVPAESLVRFLEAMGDLDSATSDQLARTLPPFGRHAGAGLIAHGHLQQEDLWPVLRAHSEWILAAVVDMNAGRVSWEEEVPVRLQDEPAVFGGAAGCEVFVEAVRRTIDARRAWELLGAGRRVLGFGGHRGLLGECALEPEAEERVQEAVNANLEILYHSQPEIFPILCALVDLDVLTTGGTQPPLVAPEAAKPGAAPARTALGEEVDDPLDDAAFQARVLARRALVDDGDYFSILGVKRTATDYEIARAREALHRQLSPARLSARNAHLLDDLELVLRIVDEAYEILSDGVRRERYRRALEATPH